MSHGSPWNHWRNAIALFGSIALLTGCAVGPNYKRPVVESPAAFRSENGPPNSAYADLAWWEVYKDGTLQALSQEALTNNYD